MITWGKMDTSGQSLPEYIGLLCLVAAMVAGSLRLHSLPDTGAIVVGLLVLLYAWKAWKRWKRNHSARAVAKLNKTQYLVETTAAALAANRLITEIRRSDPELWKEIELFRIRNAVQPFASKESLAPEEAAFLEKVVREREDNMWWKA